MNFQPLYAYLFNSITDALNKLEFKEYAKAQQILIDAQIAAEDMYIRGTMGEIPEEIDREALQAIRDYEAMFPA